MNVGDSVTILDYKFVFKGVEPHQGPNYSSDMGKADVYYEGEKITTLAAEKRFYPVQRSVMTEAGIDTGFTRDLFMALGEKLKNGDWSVRIYVKPFIDWIWAGAFIMALGGVFSISDKRYRMARLARQKLNKRAQQKDLVTEQRS
jgi:cytochrome c-type biogenesis protein CcmF